jgi:hypothetical protein
MQFWFGRIDPDALTDREALDGLVDFCMHALLAPRAART